MLSEIWEALRSKLSGRHNQVVSESVHAKNLALQGVLISCEFCMEESKPCKCGKSIDGYEDHGDRNRKSEKIDLHIDQPAAHTCSFAHAVINMVGMLIGLGQLSTPYALESGGWSSAFLLVGLGILCAYTSHLLGKCLDKNPKSRSYSDIGEHAFGIKGRVIASTFIYLEIFMALVSYTISLHDNLTRVFAGTQIRIPGAGLSSSQLLTTLAILIALPSLWLRNLSSISFLSSGGILMSLLIFISVACTAIFGGIKSNQKIPILKISNIPTVSGLYMFSYAGHIVFPNISKAMKDPSKFTKVTIVSFALVTTLYTTLAFMGAKMFGQQVNPQITLSMPPHLIVTKIALWATVLTPMTKYALEFAPFAIHLEHNMLPHSMSSKAKMFIRGSVGSILLIMILALALSIPYFEHVLSLTGSLVSICICVVFPCAFYAKICRDQISRSVLVMNLFFIAIGSLLAALGTISSSKLLVQRLHGAHDH